MKILIIRFSSIGDIVLTSPVVRCVRKKYPHAELHFCTKKQYAGLVALNPYINKLLLLDDDLDVLIKQIKSEQYTYIIDLHNNLRTRLIKLRVKSKFYAFPKINIKKWLAVNFKNVKVLPPVHVVDRYFEAVKNLEVYNDNEGLNFFTPEVKLEDIAPQLKPHDYIAVAIGAQFATKQMPAEKIISLCLKINYPVVLLGGKNDTAMGEQISLACGHVLNFCGKLNIYESAGLIKNAALVISHDTGMMHIAAAYQKTIVSLWGSTIPEFGMYPYFGKTLSNSELLSAKNSENRNLFISEVNGLSCRPCSKIGFKQCPKKHFNCMNRQDEFKIMGFIEKALSIR